MNTAEQTANWIRTVNAHMQKLDPKADPNCDRCKGRGEYSEDFPTPAHMPSSLGVIVSCACRK